MHLLKFTINEGNRPLTATTNPRQKDTRSIEFQPFQNERDSMGRLLKNTRTEERASPIPQLKQVQSSELQAPSKSRELFMQDKINRYFKQNNANKIPDLASKPTFKKTIINLLVEDQPLKKKAATILDWFEKKPEGELLQGSEFKLTKTTSCRMTREGNRPRVRRMQSNILPRYNSQSSPVKSGKSGVLSPERTVMRRSMSSKQEVKLSQYPQLNRYNRMQELQVKAFSNYEQGHMRFMEKMKQSKKLAFEVKQNLERIDDYC